MRRRFELQPGLNQTLIENIRIPQKSRDELPPLLAGLQWVFMTPEVNEAVFTLLENKILADKKATGRIGMDLWQILVLGVLRLGLNANWDRMEDFANHHTLIRQIMGIEDEWGMPPKTFHFQTIQDNTSLIDEELLQEINQVIAKAGRAVFKKKEDHPEEPLVLKTDSYVMETDVHFPTDLNLLHDAGRKCMDEVEKIRSKGIALEGWRKIKDWRRRFKGGFRRASKVVFGGGKDKEKRVLETVEEYSQTARELSAKVKDSLFALKVSPINPMLYEKLNYYFEMLNKQVDLTVRRVINKEVIPAEEKIYSIFEPHTEWINKGKLHPSVELGHRVLITTDQNHLIVDYVSRAGVDVEQSVSVAERVLKGFGEGSIASMSFDKGFTSNENRQHLEKIIPEVVMNKRGKRTAEETQRESQKGFVKLRRAHSAVESNIASLEHHGLDRCRDHGTKGYDRCVGYGVLSYNLHQIGRRLIQNRAQGHLTGLILSG